MLRFVLMDEITPPKRGYTKSGKPRRDFKGDRRKQILRFKVDLNNRMIAVARHRGVSLNAYVVDVMGRAVTRYERDVMGIKGTPSED